MSSFRTDSEKERERNHPSLISFDIHVKIPSYYLHQTDKRKRVRSRSMHAHICMLAGGEEAVLSKEGVELAEVKARATYK